MIPKSHALAGSTQVVGTDNVADMTLTGANLGKIFLHLTLLTYKVGTMVCVPTLNGYHSDQGVQNIA